MIWLAREFLNGRGQLLGRGGDLFGGRCVRLPGPELLGRRRQRLGGDLALLERLRLLLDRRLGLARAG